MNTRRRVAAAWLVNWLPIMGILTMLCGTVFGMWTLYARGLPPSPLDWVLGTIWVLFGLYAAGVASSDYKITLRQWDDGRALVQKDGSATP